MPENRIPLTVAIAQLRPEPDRLAATLTKLRDAASDARKAGAVILASGETLLPGYPSWIDHCPGAFLWDSTATKEVFARYRRQSLVVPSPATDELAEIARENELVLTVGVSERIDVGPGNRTLYNSLLTFDADGRLVQHHRKLVPTFTERTIWGPGNGQGLAAVDTRIGRVGGLICWEHWMPLARQALHESGELIHIAVWPTVHDRHQLASRHYALEGRCFVLAVGQVIRSSDLPPEFDPGDRDETLVLDGRSTVFGPDGEEISGPLVGEEGLVVAEIDPAAVDREAMALDVTGHYSRPDVFSFRVDARRQAGPPTD